MANTSGERTMVIKAALHFYHIEMGEGGAYRSYSYAELLQLRTELAEAGIPHAELDGNGILDKSDYDEDEENVDPCEDCGRTRPLDDMNRCKECSDIFDQQDHAVQG